ncbi:hypothetical protein MHY20_03450 [Helcobacillus sp. ACRRO]|uniref:glycosyltransferase n=1 Tax=Helcobacillus sp. ACRRO TaxID=2918202 RepID=UPI001EF53F8A|nr:glycosyltransferase [Helcobacillus sp. ACRRO]MCG7426676.1 hypothetical protein [Helcobacillus sp. ACRRO]
MSAEVRDLIRQQQDSIRQLQRQNAELSARLEQLRRRSALSGRGASADGGEVAQQDLAAALEAAEKRVAARDRQVQALEKRVAVREERIDAVQKRTDAQKDRIESLEKQASNLKAGTERLTTALHTYRNRVEGLKDTVTTLRDQLSSSRTQAKEQKAQLVESLQRSRASTVHHRDRAAAEQQKLASARERAAQQREKLQTSLAVTRERLKTTTELWSPARTYLSSYRQGLLYEEIEKSDIDLSADTYLSLLPSTVPAARILSRKHGGRVICDCVENVEVNKHSLAPTIRPSALELVNLTAYGSLMCCDGMMTVSHAVADTLTRFGPPVRVQPNYRYYEEAQPAGELRQMLGLGDTETILLTSGNIVEGFENVLQALTLLPSTVHLVAFSRISPHTYREQIETTIKNLGLNARVHLMGLLPYDQVAGVFADADLGLMILDPTNANHAVSLPNRVFDFTTATLPFAVPPVPEIARFVEEHGHGVAMPDDSPETWAATIRSLLTELPQRRAAARAARAQATWESLEDGLMEFLGQPSTVTMLGFRDLTRYQRFLRIAQTLSDRGVAVKAVCFSQSPVPVEIPNTEFFHFSDRYGRGEGLERVPNAH